jgi:hypothetical protein
MKLKSPVGLHPYLLGLSPALFLYSKNLELIYFSDLMLSISAALLFVLASGSVLGLLVKCRQRRTLMAGCCVVLVFAYSSMVTFLIDRLSLTIGPNSGFFLLAWVLLLVLCLYATSRFKRSAGILNKLVNVFAITLVVFSVARIISVIPEKHDYSALHINNGPLPTASTVPDPLANIFYIILDQHVGDIALEKYGYDNTAFVKALEERGFYVARRSRSNYWKTRTSVPSILNFSYFEAARQSDLDFDDPTYCAYLRDNNRVFEFLKKIGYTTVQSRTDVCHTFDLIRTADVLLDTRGEHTLAFLGLLSREMLGNTPFYKILSDLTDDNQETEHRDVVTSKIRRSMRVGIQRTKEMVHFEKPFFLFSHFFTPHMPAAFNEHGDYPNAPSRFDDWQVGFCCPEGQETVRKYLAQMEYMDKQAIELIDYIQAHSSQPPIIILQGDHGNRFKISQGDPIEESAPELYSILNAMYLPGCDYSQLYPSISSVNTFPVVFNHYFGTQIPLLDDRSFYMEKTPKDREFQDVTSYIDL